MDTLELKNIKKVAILGGGESGVGAALLAKRLGYEIWLSDLNIIDSEYLTVLQQNKIPFEEKFHTEANILDADLIIRSPGIPNTAPILQKLRKGKKNIWSEIEFGYLASHFLMGQVPFIIAITGTNGKTTTTSLIYDLLKKDGFNVEVGGNIGNSFAQLVADYDEIKEKKLSLKYYVLEISSFQLEDCFQFRPNIAVLTNISNNHLNRYDYDITKYADAKFNLCSQQTDSDYLIYCLDSPILLEQMRRYEKEKPFRAQKLGYSLIKQENAVAYLQEKSIFIDMGEKNPLKKSFSKISLENSKLKGTHNQQNSIAAGITGKLVQMRKQTMRDALVNFDSLPHRVEAIAIKNGVQYINDSKATNVNSGFFALDSQILPIIWIVGGIDKGNDYGMLLEIVKQKVKGIIILGEDRKKIDDAFNGIIPVLGNPLNMTDAVNLAAEHAEPGDCVLLSPCCASFDLFENYEERGDAFRTAVLMIEETLDAANEGKE